MNLEDSVAQLRLNLQLKKTAPILWYFVVAWCVLNYDIILYLFASEELVQSPDGGVAVINGTNEKIQFLKNNLNQQDSLWWPIAYSLFFVVLWGVIKSGTSAWWAWVSTKTDELVFKYIKDIKGISIQDHSRALGRIEELEQNLMTATSDHEQEIEALQKRYQTQLDNSASKQGELEKLRTEKAGVDREKNEFENTLKGLSEEVIHYKRVLSDASSQFPGHIKSAIRFSRGRTLTAEEINAIKSTGEVWKVKLSPGKDPKMVENLLKPVKASIVRHEGTIVTGETGVVWLHVPELKTFNFIVECMRRDIIEQFISRSNKKPSYKPVMSFNFENDESPGVIE